MNSKIIGLLIFILIIAGAVFYKTSMNPGTVKLKGYVGGEKIAFLDNPEIKKILAHKYRIELDYSKAGSIEMVSTVPANDIDFLWPSSQVALEIYKNRPGNSFIKSENIFNSPIVFYTWDIIANALMTKEIVTKEDSTFYLNKFSDFIRLISDGTKWKDIGVPQLFGKVTIISTDPTKSNSGNMFCGLLANVMFGDVVSECCVDTFIPRLQTFFGRLGYMESSSSDLFEQYLRTGVGAKPIIAGYENQIIEFSIKYKDLWPQVKNTVRIIYPRPTVWSAHPLIILNKRASVLVDALKDKDIQRIAWEQHGFRTGLMGVQNDPKIISVVGIPQMVDQVVPMPSAAVMEKLIKSLSIVN